MISRGDRVIYVGDPRLLKGTVTATDCDMWLYSPTHAVVEWDDKDLIPRQMKIPVVELKLLTDERIEPVVKYTMDDCECGRKHIDGGEHSTWCKLYGKVIDSGKT